MPKVQENRLKLRPATLEDCRRIWEWRNEQTVRQNSFNSDFIPYEQHKNWLTQKLVDQRTQIFIVLTEYEIGYVRFDITEEQAEISICIDKDERGHGYGTVAIGHSLDQLLTKMPVKHIVALIKSDNQSSITAFKRAGFVSVGRKFVAGVMAYQMVYSRLNEDKSRSGLIVNE